jgi:hypothetical protein
MQEHCQRRQQAHVARNINARKSFHNPKCWELLRILWGVDEEKNKIKCLEVK